MKTNWNQQSLLKQIVFIILLGIAALAVVGGGTLNNLMIKWTPSTLYQELYTLLCYNCNRSTFMSVKREVLPMKMHNHRYNFSS